MNIATSTGHATVNDPGKLSLDALRAGDPVEFTRLVDIYSGKIYHLGLRMLSNPQDAEDVLQETFLKAFRSLKKFDGRSSVATWLYRIAMNESLMLLRRKHPDAISIEEPTEDQDNYQEPLQIVDWCCLPEVELLSSEAKIHLDAAIDKLPQKLKMVFLLRDIEELSTSEVADILGLSETAVKTRLSRARMKIREDLSSYYSEKMKGQSYETR